uniref:ABC transporter domain-containing protein n=1 Tax=Globisporangium ultimum (strain ATCC 200006 / CBS 805.95 / DAOM BR144) TaxID=431595 RepID=K3WSR2_GLOUD
MATLSKKIGYESGDAMMVQGPHMLHEHVTSKLETALGRALPQMEVRFQNVSLSAEVAVTDTSNPKANLPTIANSVKNIVFKTLMIKNTGRKEILKNVSGVFKPGTITLLLGQPGSGKSALMKLLSGRFPVKSNIHVEGAITYNGQDQNSIKKTLPQFAAYVNQRDNHFPTLTVKETLEFAHTFCGGELTRRGEELLSNGTPEENLAALEAAKAMFAHYPEIIIKQLGLQNCQDTIVGNAMLRGVSGGERKRVTTGEMEFGMKYVTLMDEISTGLDSAATYDITNTQRSIAKTFRKTVVIALLQPSPEVFSLFDDVMIMNEGEVMYHGPRDQVLDYFQGLGFVCPPRRDVADFLLDLGTSQQHQYEVPLPPGSGKRPRYASEFAEVFRQSPIHNEMLKSLNAPHNPELLATVDTHMNPMPEFHQSFWGNTWVLMRRQMMVTMRNTAFLLGRALMVIVMGLIYASTFFQFNAADAQVVIGVMFQAILFLALGQASQIPTYIVARTIFYKQRAANFYRTAAYVVACSVQQLPLAITETIVFGSLLYWMCGFVPKAGAYFVFLLILFLTNMTCAAWFFFVAAISPDLSIAKPLAMISILLFVLFAGFVVAKSNIPDWLVWLYWIDPIAWCLRAAAVNQYRSSHFDVCVYKGVDYCKQFGKTMGKYQLGLYDVPDDKMWVWWGVLYTIGCYIVFMAMGFLVLEYKRYESPVNVVLKKKEVTADDAGTEETYQLVATPKANGTSTDSSSNGDEVAVEVHAHEQNFIPVTLSFIDLWYTVPLPSNPKESIDLLKGINGYALPGTMTALMGSSGAGKTTLMDVIAGRKTSGKIQGKILLNGYEANDLAIRRSTGYCEQMDIHSEASTIREALTFSAFLRQDSSVPDSKKYDSVNECLDLLDMNGIADQIIRGSSVEQMKRLTIGVELAAQPSVLFLDEPTSGLDARSAKVIMDGVRKVANTGRTIVCTIHQPSSEVFFLFDSLLLLKRGGRRSSSAISASENKRLLDEVLAQDGVGRPAPGSPELIFTNKRAASNFTQAMALVIRFLRMYWRTTSYNLTRIVMSILVAVIFGVVYWNADYTTYQGINGGVGMVYLVVVFNCVISFNSVLPLTSSERASFYRERASQTYNAFWYFVGSTVAEIPYTLASGVVFTIVFYFMVGFRNFGVGVIFCGNVSLLILMSTYMGQLLSYALPSVEVAAIIGVLMNTIFFNLTGFNPPAHAIPHGYIWLYLITPYHYSFATLAALLFTRCDDEPVYDEALGQFVGGGDHIGCQPVANPPLSLSHTTVKHYVEHSFKAEHSQIWENFGIVITFIVVFRVLALLSLRYINHQKSTWNLKKGQKFA